MTNQGEILLPAGTTFVTVGDLPKLIATAMYPPTAEEPTLSYVLKQTSGRQPVALTEEDLGRVKEIFVGLPPLVAGIRKAQWPEYAFAFVHAQGKPDWQLVPVWKDPVLDSVMLRTDAVDQHKRALATAIHDGRIITRTHAMVPFASNEGSVPMARIPIPDLERYVAGLGLTVRVDGLRALNSENSRWIIGEVVRQLGGQMAAAPPEEREQEGGTSGIRSDIPAAKFEANLLADIEVLRRNKLIRPRLADSSEADPSSAIDQAWRLSRTDLEHLMQYSRRNDASKQDYLAELTAYRATGRYTLRQAADHIVGEADEDFKAILARLKLAALKDELPMYLPDRNQKHDYGPDRRRLSLVSDLYEEAFWSDLNGWLAKFEPRVRYRFPAPSDMSHAEPVAPHVKRSVLQELEILAALSQLKIDPQALPRTPVGKPGIPSRVRPLVPNMSEKVFTKAWERLRATRQISDAPP